ncbi:hypothetical protein M422DRAFT_261129 [Sphaerobolus stellatus SS14]|uniref:Unplaced genomic scaffold SPHSTscaffold_102, whole genome shotgun sequence n=1 Tax=Sphaerobolus stellatus (strain SS14) TaxID=990650 RepID=A0A0C9VGV6_SPHS4|nr:hypothetical protein M422DRAFT_261129 [Sphaerobolus stellatus SS14]
MSTTNSNKTTSTSCRHVQPPETNLWDADTDTPILPQGAPEDRESVQPMREFGNQADILAQSSPLSLLSETTLEKKMNPIVSVMQSTLEAIPIMLDPHKIHTCVIYMNGTRTDATTLCHISSFINKVIQDGLIVNLVLDTHANINKGYVCVKPAGGKKKLTASTLHDRLEGFLGKKVLNTFADPRCTVVILMSICGPLILTKITH